MRTFTTNKILARRCGFTMIELLVVVVIISLMTIAAGGHFVNTYKNIQLTKSARNIVQAARFARLYAIEKQKPCKIAVDRINRKFYLVIGDARMDEQEKILKNQYIREIVLPDNGQITELQIHPARAEEPQDTAVNENESAIRFYPDGSCDSAVIGIGNAGMDYTLVFTAAVGMVDVYEAKSDDLDLIAKSVDLDFETQDSSAGVY